jgi:hypothetical protein
MQNKIMIARSAPSRYDMRSTIYFNGANMKSYATRLACLVVACAFPVAASAAWNMQWGLWDSTANIGGKPTPMGTACYLQKDLVELEALYRGKLIRDKDPCKYSDYAESGNTVNYTMTCKYGNETTVSQVKATYNGTASTSSITTAGVVVNMTSKRIGTCTETSYPK